MLRQNKKKSKTHENMFLLTKVYSEPAKMTSLDSPFQICGEAATAKVRQLVETGE